MAHIRTKTLKNGRKAYLVVWTDPAGKEKSTQFSHKGSAKEPGTAIHFKVQIESELSRGTYIDPGAGKVTFSEYAEEWRTHLHGRPGYDDRLESILRNHVLPEIGDMRIGAIRRREVQALVKVLSLKRTGDYGLAGKKSRPLSPNYIENIINVVAMVFRAAVVDEIIGASPCTKLRMPEKVESEFVIPTTEQVLEVAERVPERYRALVLAAAGTGLRSGELLGLDVERVRFLEGVVRVDRQLVTPLHGTPYFGPPKTKAGYREVPLQPNLRAVLAHHIERFGWGETGAPSVGVRLPRSACSTTGLLFSNRSRRPVRRGTLGDALRPVLSAMGFPERSGMHLFRHYYASLLIYNGEDPKTIQVRMGHATQAETMDTYGHLFPRERDRSGAAVDAIFAGAAESPRLAAVDTPPGPSQVRGSVSGPSNRGHKLSIMSSHAHRATQVSGSPRP